MHKIRNRVTKFLGASALVIGLAACASQPPVQQPAPVEPPPPPPVVTEAEPEPVVREPIVRPAYTGPVRGSVEDFIVTVGDRVYFDVDRYSLDAEDQGILQRQAAWLASYPNVRVLVAGNADERGTREYNLALGDRRATAVKDYLVSLGVDPARIQTVSYGKERPIDPRSTEEAWAINRNGHTQIVSGAVG